MLFSDIVGHDKIKESLMRMICDARVGHAYIFEGAEGSGRLTTALSFAQALVCENPNYGEACGVCRACHMCDSMSHPDIRIITNQLYDPAKKSKDILVDTVRNMKNEIYIKPYLAKHKIYIVPNAGTMNVSAQNSLLKVFEEPPEYCTIILITYNSELFLPTILSRAVMLKFNALNLDLVSKYLMTKFEDISENTAHVKACMSGGYIGKALELMNDKEAEGLREDTLKCVMNFLEENHVPIYEAMLFFKKNKEKMSFFMNILRDFFRDLLYYTATKDEKNIMNFDKIEEIRSLSNNVSEKSILNMLDILFKYENYFSKNISYSSAVQCMVMELWEEINDRGYRS